MKQPIPLLTAAANMIAAFGGNVPDWLQEEYDALETALRTLYTPEWPHGVQHLSMPHAMVSDEPGGPLEPKCEPVRRVESGPVQFGDDWPGLFLRGDSCFAYALALKAERSNNGDAFSRAGIDGLITALESARVKHEGEQNAAA